MHLAKIEPQVGPGDGSGYVVRMFVTDTTGRTETTSLHALKSTTYEDALTEAAEMAKGMAAILGIGAGGN